MFVCGCAGHVRLLVFHARTQDAMSDDLRVGFVWCELMLDARCLVSVVFYSFETLVICVICVTFVRASQHVSFQI